MKQRRHGKDKPWSHIAGIKGKNRVRAYQDAPGGKYYVEWQENVLDPETGEVVTIRGRDNRLRPKKQRKRLLLQGVMDPAEAAARADRLAARFAELDSPAEGQAADHPGLAPGGPGLLLADIIDLYLEEETPTKGESKQDHDRRAARIFIALWGQKPAVELGRREWAQFIAARKRGELAGFKPVGSRQIAYDLKFLISVLNWGVGSELITRNPWSPDRRKVGGMRMPKESRPYRPAMSDELRERLIQHSGNWRFALALRLGRQTVSRNSSVRHLRWSDVDLVNGTIRWREEFDKNGQEVVVPLTPAALAALRAAPRGIGEAWIFPSEKDPTQPTSRHSFQIWLRRAKASLLEAEKDPAERRRLQAALHRVGFHSEKRSGVRDGRFRSLPPKVQEAIARTNHDTLRKVYDDVSLDDLRDEMREAGLLTPATDTSQRTAT